MNTRYPFILFCATALFVRIPTADAYTAIAVASSNSNGGGERYAAWYFDPEAAGSHPLHPGDMSHSAIEQLALKNCRRKGGINPKIVLATDKPGYFAIAVGVITKHCVGWPGPLPSPEAAAQEAIA
jgi:hypothetical protein